MGISRPIFPLFSSFSHHIFDNTNWKKRRWCALDLNLWLHDGRCRRCHGVMSGIGIFVCNLFCPTFRPKLFLVFWFANESPYFVTNISDHIFGWIWHELEITWHSGYVLIYEHADPSEHFLRYNNAACSCYNFTALKSPILGIFV